MSLDSFLLYTRIKLASVAGGSGEVGAEASHADSEITCQAIPGDYNKKHAWISASRKVTIGVGIVTFKISAMKPIESQSRTHADNIEQTQTPC